MLITLTMGATQKMIILMTMLVSTKANHPKHSFVAVQMMIVHVPTYLIVTTLGLR